MTETVKKRKRSDCSTPVEENITESASQGDYLNKAVAVTKRNRYTFEEKKKILEECKSLNARELCVKYGINRSVLSKWRSNEETIKNAAKTSHTKTLKKVSETNELDDELFTWLSDCRWKGIPVSGPMLCQQALVINSRIGGPENFKASHGWLEKWRRRRAYTKNLDIPEFHEMPAQYYSTSMNSTRYETISVTVPKEFVYHVELNRPTKLNAVNSTMWQEFGDCFKELGDNPDCRAIVLSGSGKIFTAGIDLHDAMIIGQMTAEHDDVARKSKILKNIIKKYQDSITSLEKCEKPVIAAVHGACIGAGIDMITAADIRYCSKDAWFQIKEVDLGMAADVGTLQRFPKVIGSDSLARELAYTARKFLAQEALECGFVNRLFDNHEKLLAESIAIAEEISKKSPVAIQGTKLSMVYSRDHSVQEGLDHIAHRNETMLQSEDFMTAAAAAATKGAPPAFSKL